MEKSTNNGNIAGFFDVYFLGIVLVISGVLTYWNIGFLVGFWEYFFATVIISVGYMVLVLCLAEMISILPFSGGSYGFSRVTMGPYLGFLVGCFDSVTNIIYVSSLVRGVCSFITNTIGPHVPHEYDPVYWLICYVFCLIVLIPLGRWNFSFMTIVGAITLALPIMYALATANTQNFDKYASHKENYAFFEGGMKSFMQVLPVPTWMYIGIDLVCLVCDDTKDAMRVVPKAIVWGMITLIVLAFLVMVTSASNAPGIVTLAEVAFPLNAGFSTAFNISDRLATILSIPGVFISTYSLIYAYGRQICAMSRSKLLPVCFSWTTKDNVPYMALCGGCLLGYAILLGLYYNDADYMITLNYLFYASQMGSFTVYIVSMISFIIFRYKYKAMERHYVNKLGSASAVIGIIVFLFAFVGVGFFQDDAYESIVMYVCFIAIMSVYYLVYARHHQCFSPEEQSILFAVYVIKSNSRKKTVWNWMSRKVHTAAEHLDPHHYLHDIHSNSRRKKSTKSAANSRNNSKNNSKHNSQNHSKNSQNKDSSFGVGSSGPQSLKNENKTGDEVELITHDLNEEDLEKHNCELDEEIEGRVRLKSKSTERLLSSNENTVTATLTSTNTTMKIVPVEDDDIDEYS